MGVFACRGRPPGHPAFFRAVEGAGPYGQDPGFSRVGAGLVPARGRPQGSPLRGRWGFSRVGDGLPDVPRSFGPSRAPTPTGKTPGFSRLGAGLVPARVSTTRVAPTGKTPSLAEFFARRRKTIWIVFSGSVYLGKNTSHLARQTKLIPLRFHQHGESCALFPPSSSIKAKALPLL